VSEFVVLSGVMNLNTMPSVKRIIRDFSPDLLHQIVLAKRALAPVSHQPWLDACSRSKRAAIYTSRFSILPPTFKNFPTFVIDVGACQGRWIGSLLEILPIPEVWIFEPNPGAMKECQQRIGSRPGVKYFQMALGDRVGQIVLNVTASSELGSVLQPRDEFLETYYGNNEGCVVEKAQVELCTLDSLVPESKCVDLLKIDVQGFERAVLSGARRVLANTRAVLIETLLQSHYVGDDNLAALWTILADHGFSFWNISPPYVGQDGRALWADAVFVK
jgi:FkbM family methyltransferase